MIIDEFISLFTGYEGAHGQHELATQPDENGKLKGRAKTVIGGATRKEYEHHLRGQGTSLGIIPLMADDRCAFGALDIDIQGEVRLNETIESLEDRIRKFDLPLVVCRSKSGGAHLYLLCDPPISAKLVQAKLGEFASTLGYGGCEVFPKQVMRANENDRGNWINVAMYGALHPEGTTRFCIRNGKAISDLAEFIAYAKSMRVSAPDLKDVRVKLVKVFEDGPPCLQYLATFGLSSGGRNIALTNVATYFKRKFPDDWQDHVMKFNFEHVQPNLDVGEVNQILKNIGRKDYYYTCKNPPLCNHCDKKVCIKREFGVTFGNTDSQIFPLDNVTKCVSKDSVRWYAEHQGCRVELTTEQLLSPAELQKVFIERFTMVIIPGKRSEWLVRLKELMESCSTIEDPDDASTQGQFENLLDGFFTNSRPARNRDEIIKGNSYTEEGRVYFRSEDLFNYLNVRRFGHTPHQVWTWLKGLKAESSQMRIKGKMVRVWSLPEPERYDGSDLALPDALDAEL